MVARVIGCLKRFLKPKPSIYRKGIELISQSDPAVAVEQVSIAKGEVNRLKGVISLDIPTPQ